MSVEYGTEVSEEQAKSQSQGAIGGGLVLIVLATVLNFVLDGMSPDEVAELPWFIALAFESRGKLGVTVVLCTIGVLLIVWGYVNAPGEKTAAVSSLPRQPPNPAQAERPLTNTDSPGKIPARGAGFGAPVAAPATAPVTPRPRELPPPTGPGGGGGIVLETAKYLKPDPPVAEDDPTDAPPLPGIGPGSAPPDFRKGRVISRHTE